MLLTLKALPIYVNMPVIMHTVKDCDLTCRGMAVERLSQELLNILQSYRKRAFKNHEISLEKSISQSLLAIGDSCDIGFSRDSLVR